MQGALRRIGTVLRICSGSGADGNLFCRHAFQFAAVARIDLFFDRMAIDLPAQSIAFIGGDTAFFQ
jgi:hypothetical protein